LGGSAAALKQLTTSAKHKLNPNHFPQHFSPQPRLALGRTLRERGLASAMIDISDGLSTDLAHICEESGVGAKVLSEAIPRATIGKHSHEVDLQSALHGGEDYELLFTARVPVRKKGVHKIGAIMAGEPGRVLLDNRPLRAAGYDHFRSAT